MRPSTIMTTATQLSERPKIDYPDSDGLPMTDNALQYEWIVTIKGGLDATRRAFRRAASRIER
jgi:hypothetical protein